MAAPSGRNKAMAERPGEYKDGYGCTDYRDGLLSDEQRPCAGGVEIPSQRGE